MLPTIWPLEGFGFRLGHPHADGVTYWGSTETRSLQREVGLVHEVEVQVRFSLAL